MARPTTLTEEIAQKLEFYWQLAGDTMTDEKICARIGITFDQLCSWLKRNMRGRRPDGTRLQEGLRQIRERAKATTLTGYLANLQETRRKAEEAGDYKTAAKVTQWLLEKQFPNEYGNRNRFGNVESPEELARKLQQAHFARQATLPAMPQPENQPCP